MAFLSFLPFPQGLVVSLPSYSLGRLFCFCRIPEQNGGRGETPGRLALLIPKRSEHFAFSPAPEGQGETMPWLQRARAGQGLLRASSFHSSCSSWRLVSRPRPGSETGDWLGVRGPGVGAERIHTGPAHLHASSREGKPQEPPPPHLPLSFAIRVNINLWEGRQVMNESEVRVWQHSDCCTKEGSLPSAPPPRCRVGRLVSLEAKSSGRGTLSCSTGVAGVGRGS